MTFFSFDLRVAKNLTHSANLLLEKLFEKLQECKAKLIQLQQSFSFFIHFTTPVTAL